MTENSTTPVSYHLYLAFISFLESNPEAVNSHLDCLPPIEQAEASISELMNFKYPHASNSEPKTKPTDRLNVLQLYIQNREINRIYGLAYALKASLSIFFNRDSIEAEDETKKSKNHEDQMRELQKIEKDLDESLADIHTPPDSFGFLISGMLKRKNRKLVNAREMLQNALKHMKSFWFCSNSKEKAEFEWLINAELALTTAELGDISLAQNSYKRYEIDLSPWMKDRFFIVQTIRDLEKISKPVSDSVAVLNDWKFGQVQTLYAHPSRTYFDNMNGYADESYLEENDRKDSWKVNYFQQISSGKRLLPGNFKEINKWRLPLFAHSPGTIENAVMERDLKSISMCLKRGDDPTRYDNFCIRMAARNNHTEAVKLLLTHPQTDPSRQVDASQNDNEALFLAWKYFFSDVFQILANNEQVRKKSNELGAVKSNSIVHFTDNSGNLIPSSMKRSISNYIPVINSIVPNYVLGITFIPNLDEETQAINEIPSISNRSLSAFNNLTDLEIWSIARFSYRIDRLCTVVEVSISFSKCLVFMIYI